MGSYRALKRKEILSFIAMQMKLEGMILSETSKSEKDKHCMVPPVCGTQSSQIHGHRKQSGGCRGLMFGEGMGMGKLVLNEDGGSVWEHEKVLKMDSDGGAQQYEEG